MVAAEYLSLDSSKGEVLVFRRKHSTKEFEASKQDVEAGPFSTASTAPEIDSRGHISDGVTGSRILTTKTHPSIFHWSNICYDILIKEESRRILDHVDGWVKPGTLTALMVSCDTHL
jgi:ATP-binding cassette, subfamily G (WHITE), member 2, PDR